MAEKKVTFSAQDNGVSSTIARLKRDSAELSKGLIADARKYSDSGREQVKFIEDQIRLIQRRNTLDRQQQEFQAKERLQSSIERGEDPKRSRTTFQKEISEIKTGSTQDDLQVQVLQDILSTLKENAQREIVEDKKNVENNVKAFDRALSRGDVTVDDEEAFKLALQRSMIGDDKESSRKERAAFSGISVGDGINRGLGLATSKNEIFAAAAVLAIIPAVGQGLSEVATKLIQEGDRLQKATLGYSAITGSSIDFIEASQMGYTQAETYEFAQQLARARGSAGLDPESRRIFGGDVQTETRQLLATQRAYNLDPQSLLSLSRTQRFDRNQRGTFGDIQNLITIMRREGVFGTSGEDMSSLQAILETQNSLIVEQSKTMETVNTDTNLRIIAAFNRIGGSFSANDPRSLQRMMTINQALQQPQGDYRQAFAYSILRDIDPSADIFQLQEMKERGIAQPGYLQGAFERIRGRGGNQSSQMLQFQSFTDLSFEAVRRLFENASPDAFAQFEAGNLGALGMTPEQVAGRARGATGIIDRRSAETADFFAENGLAGLELVDIGFQSLSQTLGKFNTLNGQSNSNLSQFNENLEKSNANLTQLNKTLQVTNTNSSKIPNGN